jgi:hypothetical protein
VDHISALSYGRAANQLRTVRSVGENELDQGKASENSRLARCVLISARSLVVAPLRRRLVRV